jgi:hypothetical protein
VHVGGEVMADRLHASEGVRVDVTLGCHLFPCGLAVWPSTVLRPSFHVGTPSGGILNTFNYFITYIFLIYLIVTSNLPMVMGIILGISPPPKPPLHSYSSHTPLTSLQGLGGVGGGVIL